MDLHSIKSMEYVDDDVDGIILSIVVKNFFCHDNYELKLEKNVNYVVGRNGSGKSAFVTALVVGFGGKAAATNRGTNLTCFIKKGTEAASVAIKIKNSSPMAYKHETFGDSITVIHEFSVTGSSSYKVKSHSGRVISTKFKDVQDIALAHNIQVDNPVSVLNQDEARSFHSNEPEKKYSFFRRATNFDKTEKYYNESLDLCKKAEDKWETKKSAAKNLEEEYNRWNTLHERMLSRHEIEKRKKELENEYLWGEVVELERSLEDVRELQTRRAQRVERLQAERDSLAALAASELHVERDKLKAAQQERDSAERALLAAQDARRRAEQDARRRELAAAHLRDKRTQELRKMQDLRDEIQNMNVASARAELEQRAAACEQACEAVRARLRTTEHTAQQARQNAARARDLCDEAQERVQRLRAKTETARGELRALQRAGSDTLSVYGPLAAELRRRVDAAVARGAFEKPPRGPVGAYIKLRDRKWGSALEFILGNTVFTFCADNNQDVRTLSSIIAEVYRGRSDKPSVSFSRFRTTVHDVADAAVRPPGYTCALDALIVDDPVVANYLIDNLALETVLLVPDDDTAMKLTSKQQHVPPNLRRAVTSGCAEFYPAPNYRTYGGRAKPVRYLHQDLAGRIRQVESEVQECARAEREAASASEDAVAAWQAADGALRAEERALRALRTAAEAADTQLEEARSALRLHNAPTHQALEDELRVSEERLKNITEQLQREDSAAEVLAPLVEQVDAASAQLQRARHRYKALQERVEEEERKLETGRCKIAVLDQRLDALRGEQQRAQGTLEANSVLLDTKLKMALDLCERVDNPRSTSAVLEELNEVKARLRAGLGTTMSRADVGERLLEVASRHRAVQRDMHRIRALIDQIKEVVNRHLKLCYNMQKDIVRNVQCSFECVLKLRNFTGELEVDMGRGQLSVACAPNGTAAGGTASLSGGERSYATVALLIALWQCVDLPFFFLDEFDVFMDNVNRKAVIDLMEYHAFKRRGRQYVFLTPQDGTKITGHDLVNILSLTK